MFLVQVGGGEDVKQRQPRAGALEKEREAPFIRTCRVIDEFAPAIAVPRNRANGFQRDRWVGAVQSLDQTVPSDVEPQILRLVDDARAIVETNDVNRPAAVVRIREVPFDRDDAGVGAGAQQVAADLRQICRETVHEFPGCIEPLPRQRCQKTQQHRLVFEQPAKPARLHAGHELLVGTCTGTTRFGEAFVERRRGKGG